MKVSAFAFLQVFFTYVVVCCTAAVTPDTITTPISLRQIPTDVVRESLPTKSVTEDLVREVYEISDDGLLVGQNITVDLRENAQPISELEESEPFDYIVNGEEHPSYEVDSVIVHAVNGLEVMYDDNDKVAMVWGEDLFLLPLDSEKFPGVFVNARTIHTSETDYKVIAEDESNPLSLDTSGKQNVRSRTVDVAVAYDNTFCSRFGGNNAATASQALRRTVNQSSTRFRRDTTHRLRVSRVEAHCNDNNDPYDYRAAINGLPLNGDRASLILNRFRTFWNNNRRNVNRDVAYLFTGYQDNTGVAGVAYVGAACTQFAYGWVEGNSVPIFVHEMGHSLGCDHSPTGIMQAVLRQPNAPFSAFSVNQMNTFLGTSRADCIA